MQYYRKNTKLKMSKLIRYNSNLYIIVCNRFHYVAHDTIKHNVQIICTLWEYDTILKLKHSNYIHLRHDQLKFSDYIFDTIIQLEYFTHVIPTFWNVYKINLSFSCRVLIVKIVLINQFVK